MDKKIIFLDVDGTLADFHGNIPESAVEAVTAARARGHQLVVCTGRLKAQIYPEVLALGFDGIIASAGAYVEHQGKVVAHQVIDSAHLKVFADYFESIHTGYCFQRDGEIIVTRDSKREIDRHFREAGMDEEKVKKVMVSEIHVVEDIRSYRDVEKGAYYDSGRGIGEIQAALGDYFKVEGSSYEKGDGDSGEITRAGVNKATGIEAYVAFVGGNMKDTIAFGDGPNDTEMLARTEISVAMGNASDELKVLADLVTEDVDKDGLKNAFKRLKLI